ncbi:MAG: LTA synthase family protein [Oscillospiraceae bacterium]|nr:LTA synthase family protein [Oscillospiraceae bacterium]
MEWDLDKYLQKMEPKPLRPAQKAPAAASRTEPERAERPAQPERSRTEQPRRSPGDRPRTSRPNRSAQSRRRVGSLPPWVLVLVCLLFYSLCFHIFCVRFWADKSFSVGRFLTLTVLNVAFALLSALIATAGKKRRLQTVLALVIVIVWGFLFLMEYFILDSFKNFYTLGGIFAGAGNAGQDDFAARTLGLVGKNVWRILLFALPVVLWFLANRFLRLPRILTRGVRRYLAAAGAGLLLVGLFFASVISPDRAKMGEAYNFTDAVRGFGLPMGFALDAFKGGNDGDLDIDATGWTMPAEEDTTVPVRTEPPAQTDSNGDPLPPATGDPLSTTEPTEPPTPTKKYNMLDIDFDSIIANAKNDNVKDVARYASTLAPSRTNAYTGMFKGKNLIIVCAEGFAKELIDKDLTPTLYRMATQGIEFTDYYQPAWGGSTSTGEFSVLTGIEPSHGVKSMELTIGKDMFMTMGNQLRRLGYFSRAYHDHTYTYYDRNKTHENLGYEKFIGRGNGMEDAGPYTWPESDLDMINFTVPQYIDKQPFSIYYMTVSGHGLYTWGGNAMSARHREEVQSLPYSDTIKGFFACNLEVELAMESLVKQLEEAGIADDTVVVLTADHYPYCLQKSDTWGNPQDYLSELYGYQVTNSIQQDHNALILWSGCLEGKNIKVTDPTFSLDIVPTLSNLFGVEYDSRMLSGRDVFSDQEPLVFWPDHSWKTDKGTWDASKSSGSEFIPAEGVTVDEEYLNRIRKTVSNKINFSYKLLDTDFFKLIDPQMN